MVALAAPPQPPPEPVTAPIPRYQTLLPPATTLHYTLWRAGHAEHAELHWQPEGAQYRLTLMGYASEGGFDADGVAPERHTESRRGREWRAVNFQRAAGRISFSGSQANAALTPGAQDRLSWLVQLAAVLAAEPALRAPGSMVQMVVAGVRGEATLWPLQVQDEATLELPAGSVPHALHLRYVPAAAYGLAVDVWLDPARGYLPVQVQMQRPGSPPDAAGNLLLQLTTAES
ncbi:MAG: DUF3108 domain-containing protein [Pseudomonadota bacterium]|nr:DUF3108 domain-containing protein [Pseudomonadota bacterium]